MTNNDIIKCLRDNEYKYLPLCKLPDEVRQFVLKNLGLRRDGKFLILNSSGDWVQASSELTPFNGLDIISTSSNLNSEFNKVTFGKDICDQLFIAVVKYIGCNYSLLLHDTVDSPETAVLEIESLFKNHSNTVRITKEGYDSTVYMDVCLNDAHTDVEHICIFRDTTSGSQTLYSNTAYSSQLPEDVRISPVGTYHLVREVISRVMDSVSFDLKPFATLMDSMDIKKSIFYVYGEILKKLDAIDYRSEITPEYFTSLERSFLYNAIVWYREYLVRHNIGAIHRAVYNRILSGSKYPLEGSCQHDSGWISLKDKCSILIGNVGFSFRERACSDIHRYPYCELVVIPDSPEEKSSYIPVTSNLLFSLDSVISKYDSFYKPEGVPVLDITEKLWENIYLLDMCHRFFNDDPETIPTKMTKVVRCKDSVSKNPYSISSLFEDVHHLKFTGVDFVKQNLKFFFENFSS